MREVLKIKNLGESALIEKIRQWLGTGFIGDDCAVLPFREKSTLLATSDVLVENVHFRPKFCHWRAVGFKAIAVNVSDIAAMGGRPRFALVSLGLKAEMEFKKFQQLYSGLKTAAAYFSLQIVGGNLSASPVNFIDVFLLGEISKGHLLKRSGACPGDKLYLTGTLGKAVAKNYRVTEADFRKIRLEEGIFMAENGLATAAIDLSDSLAKAVVELVSRSRVGAKIFLEQVPVEKKVGLKKALGGGDDFELLFAIPAKICREAEKKFRKKFSVPLTEIGVITQNPKVLYLKNGRILKPATENFQHF